jgi:hypothetical protein
MVVMLFCHPEGGLWIGVFSEPSAQIISTYERSISRRTEKIHNEDPDSIRVNKKVG